MNARRLRRFAGPHRVGKPDVEFAGRRAGRGELWDGARGHPKLDMVRCCREFPQILA